MGLDKNNIPDEYLCEVCKPRPVDRKKARAMQSKRRSDLFNSSNDDSPRHGKKAGIGSRSTHKKMNDRKAGKDRPGGGSSKGSVAAKEKNNKNKQYRKRKPSEKSSGKTAASGGGAKSVVKPRRKSAAMDNDYDVMGGRGDGKATAIAAAAMVDSDDEDDVGSGLLKEPTLDASQQLRSWIDQYEEAVTNHYSPELRARLMGTGNGKINGISQDLRPSVINAPVKSNVSLKGNGVKVMPPMQKMSPISVYTYSYICVTSKSELCFLGR